MQRNVSEFGFHNNNTVRIGRISLLQAIRGITDVFKWIYKIVFFYVDKIVKLFTHIPRFIITKSQGHLISIQEDVSYHTKGLYCILTKAYFNKKGYKWI